LWPKVQKQYPDLRDKEYEQVPRGRVLYDAGRRQYVLLCSDVVAKNRVLLAQIMRRFNLPREATRVVVDQHYNDPAQINWDEDADDAAVMDRVAAKIGWRRLG
jgi:hypothetical protein